MAETNSTEGQLKEELDWVCGPGGSGFVLDLVYRDNYELHTTQAGADNRTFMWSLGNIFTEFNSSGVEQNFVLQALGMDTPIEHGRPDGSGRETLLTDLLQTALTGRDDAGSEIRAVEHNAYGTVRAGTDSGPVGFHGARKLGSTGLLYPRNRIYDPSLGRFLSRDPIGFAGGPNKYVYAENNPVSLRDPEGLFGVGQALGFGFGLKDAGDLGDDLGRAWGADGWSSRSVYLQDAAGDAALLGLDALSILDPTSFTGSLNATIRAARLARAGRGAQLALATAQLTVQTGRAIQVTALGGRAGIEVMLAKSCTSGNSARAQRGMDAHRNYERFFGPEVENILEFNKAIEGTRLRPDAIDWANNIVRELKPDNQRAVIRGMDQLRKYVDALERLTHQTWRGFLDRYK